MQTFNTGDYAKVSIGSAGFVWMKVLSKQKNGRYKVASYSDSQLGARGQAKGNARQSTVDPRDMVSVEAKDIQPDVLERIDNKFNQMNEGHTMSSEDLINLALEGKPNDFKDAIYQEMNDRVRTALNDKREEMSAGIFGEGVTGKVVNHDDKTDKKPEPGTKQAEEPKATNPGAMGHEQKDEKKTGSKKAVEPKATGAGKKQIPESVDLNESNMDMLKKQFISTVYSFQKKSPKLSKEDIAKLVDQKGSKLNKQFSVHVEFMNGKLEG